MPQKLATKRHLRRHQLKNAVDVVDVNSQLSLGRLVNIHHEGLMILGSHLEDHSVYQIKLLLPYSINQSQHIDLAIECLWCQESSEHDNLFWSGNHIIDISSFAKACITSLINIQSK